MENRLIRLVFSSAAFAGAALFGLSASGAYTQLESIKGSGSTWIYSGYRPQCTDRVEIDFLPDDKTSTATLFCSRGTTTSKDTFTCFLVGGKVRYDRNTTTTGPSITYTLERHVVVSDGAKLEGILDGGTSGTLASGTFTPGSVFSLFASHALGTSLSESSTGLANFGKHTLYSFKVYTSTGDLVVDMVPARDESAASGTTAQYGLFDRVTKTFRKGLGSGTFTAGAVIGEVGGLGGSPNVWNGNASAFWSDAGNWSKGTVPAADEAVEIPLGKAPVLTNATKQLSQLIVSGTLTFSNEAASVSAGKVVILNGGVVTCAAGVPEEGSYLTQKISRVQIACTDLAVNAGGKIDVSQKGWISYPTTTLTGNAYCRGYGPGSVAYANADDAAGPAHGGAGSTKGVVVASSGANLSRPQVYDDPSAPTQAGSSGASQQWGRGGFGGGVVSVVATGSVTVNGSILADGGTVIGHSASRSGSNHDCAGSGGSVSIVCKTISGSGVISAEGGSGDIPTTNGPGMAAGGGCIAIRYDTAQQTSAKVSGLRVSAADGTYLNKNYNPGRVGEIAWQNDPDIGTVWFSDDKIVRALLGNGLMGQIKNVTNYTHAGDLAFTYGHVRFAEEGANVEITGNLTFGGSDSRLEVGGCLTTNRSMYTEIFGGRKVNKLTVGGDLTLAGVSRLDVRAAETNGVDAFGALVKVGGTMTVSTNCSVYAWSDVRNAGAPRFEVGNLNVATGGVFSAALRGGSGSRYSSYYAYGNSSGKDGNAGGGHGGLGGKASSTSGRTNDNAERPSLPGSGGGSQKTNWAYGGRGGGVVSVAATNGTIRIDGKVTADGGTAYRYGGGGAGGTILLEAKQMMVGEAGVVTANGGNTKGETSVGGGAGGGGRVALWCGAPWTPATPVRKCKNFTETPTAYPEDFVLSGTVSADGGLNTGTATGTDGSAGTIRYMRIDWPTGLLLLVR